jgi:hypothetical protein
MGPVCPQCGKDFVRRAHRKGVLERILSAVYCYPYRCQLCTHRFRAFEWGAHYERKAVDQREYERIPVELPLNFAGARVKGEGNLVTLSMGGCSFQANVTVNPGEILQLSFQPTAHDPSIVIDAAVIRSVRPPLVGAEFLRVQPTQKEALRQVVLRHLAAPRPPTVTRDASGTPSN